MNDLCWKCFGGINRFVKLAREIISLYGNSLFSFEQYDNYIHVTARRARYIQMHVPVAK